VLDAAGPDRPLLCLTASVLARLALRPDPTPPTTWVVGSGLRLVVRRKKWREEGAAGGVQAGQG
jgi:hypothetical protein